MDINIEIQKDGWSVRNSFDNVFILEYGAGIIEELGACFIVNKKIYNDVKNSSITLEQLIKKYDILNKLEKLYTPAKSGKVLPWFDEIGGGTQYEFDNNIQWLLDNDYLIEI